LHEPCGKVGGSDGGQGMAGGDGPDAGPGGAPVAKRGPSRGALPGPINADAGSNVADGEEDDDGGADGELALRLGVFELLLLLTLVAANTALVVVPVTVGRLAFQVCGRAEAFPGISVLGGFWLVSLRSMVL
jgi:hypothetical protein